MTASIFDAIERAGSGSISAHSAPSTSAFWKTASQAPEKNVSTDVVVQRPMSRS